MKPSERIHKEAVRMAEVMADGEFSNINPYPSVYYQLQAILRYLDEQAEAERKEKT